MRRPLLLALLATLVAAAPARAERVTLWGCHGPDGAPLAFPYTASGTVEVEVGAAGGGCTAAGGTLRIAFRRPDPASGQWGSLRFAASAGVRLEHVWLGRRATGPGYWARSSGSALEALAGSASLEGSLTAAAAGDWVEVGLRCETPGPRCDAPDARVDLRFAALTVRDDSAPTFTAEGLPSVATGTFAVAVDARDAGVGVARASATLGGTPVAAAQAGHARCAELSPADATRDLPLAEDCPSSDRLILAIDSRAVADGAQPLELLVVDGAGNTTTKTFELRVGNTPPAPVPSTPPIFPPGGIAIAPPPPVPTTGEITVRQRYKVGSDGRFSVTARCPTAAPASCAITLKLTAKLPGRRKAATIATARSTVKPGRRAKLHLRLSRSARSALRSERMLTARLTLEGTAPVSVKLAR